MADAALCGIAVLFLTQAPATAQDAAPPPTREPATLQTGPAEVARHWSKYEYPGSIPEGAPYLIIKDGDTLWDLAGTYLGSPFLWPQIWEQNQYIADAHWIYPGDPLLLPRLQVVAEHAGELGPEGMPEEGEEGAAGMPTELAAGEEAGSLLYPITEETTMFCAGYVTDESIDDSLRINGAEEKGKVAFGTNEFVYLNKGANSGVRAGDVYAVHAKGRKVKHPKGGGLGRRILTQGTLRVLMVEDESALAVVEMACSEMHLGDFLTVYEAPNVPLALRQDPPNRLTPPTGKLQGYIVDLIGDLTMGGTGHLVTLDLGVESGIAPGNLLVAYRKGNPNGEIRQVLGEVAVIDVRERTSTAKILSSLDAILVGDRVELR